HTRSKRDWSSDVCSSDLGALRAGAGLVTLFVKEEVYPLIAAMPPAEVMVRPVKDYREVSRQELDALAIGPGLGLEFEDEILTVRSEERRVGKECRRRWGS